MIDLSPIKDYCDAPSNFTKDFIKHHIINKNIYSLLEYDFRSIDCTRITDNGIRMMQTIGSPYRVNITEIVYIINNYVDDDKKDEYYSRLLDIHNKNIEYEKLNPPIWYGGEKAKKQYEKEHSSNNTRTRKPRQKRIEFSDEVKQPNAAERKLAAKIAKINKLSFNIKPSSQNDTL